MSKKQFAAQFNRENESIEVSLNILCWIEDKVHFVYAPALDLTGYGNSEEEARQSFEYQLEEFVNYTSNKSTLLAELEKLGWDINRKKKKLTAPGESEMLKENETYRELLSMPGITSQTRNIAFAL